ncbi:hypothetical protein CASFOL_018310 [Castilleja foliolosa]|uniref:Uncharacterized protein n=1 Tax=Castilleja foliolosa TaxID=1961234 RepID=A0ABD3DAS8_9LAMI
MLFIGLRVRSPVLTLTENSVIYLAVPVGNKLKTLMERKSVCSVECIPLGIYSGYDVEVVVSDETDSAKFVMWNRASEKLIGEHAADIIATYGDTARIMPYIIEEKLLGREGLFEVIVTSDQNHVEFFNVSRLTVDEEIKDMYIMKNFPVYESSSEDDSFLKSLYYVEKDDRVEDECGQAVDEVTENATMETANECDADAIKSPKRQKKEGTDNK